MTQNEHAVHSGILSARRLLAWSTQEANMDLSLLQVFNIYS